MVFYSIKHKIVYLKVVLITAFIAISFGVKAQNHGFNNDRNDRFNTGSFANDTLKQEMDTVGGDRKTRIKKPNLSYLFRDTVKFSSVYTWNFSPKNNTVKIMHLDTMLNDFQKDYIFFQNQSVGAIYIGNLGGAETSLDYFKRANMQYFSFLNSFEDYLFTPEKIKFYNGKKPFTQLSFFMSGQSNRAEEQLRVIHAQNISPSTSFTLDYRNNGTRGMYNDQRSKDKNLALAVAHTGKNLTIHSGYTYNMGDIYENGGLIDDGQVKDTLIDLPQNLEMNLKDAHNRVVGHTFFFTGSYAIPFVPTDSLETIANVPAMFIGTSINYTTYEKLYRDSKDGTSDGFYDNWYINPTHTLDSISQQYLDMSAFIQLQPYDRNGIIGTIDAGVGFKNEKYYNFKMPDYISPSDTEKENSIYVFGNIGGKISKYVNWHGSIDYTPIGYRNQDIKITGNIDFSAFIKNKPLILSGSVLYSLQEPSYWSQHYFSNHFMWNNSFKKENEIRFNANLKIPDYGIEAGFTQAILNNKVYYNSESMPQQFGDALSVTSVLLRKDFRLGGLHFNNRVLLQLSSNQEVVPVPLASVNSTCFFEFNVVKDVLKVQIGVDGYYNTEYNGLAYNPAIMQFYNQTTTKVGNYPWVDAFVSGKWKTLRFLIKYQHANYDLFGGRNYFSVAHYPLNRSMLKMGVSWNFYD